MVTTAERERWTEAGGTIEEKTTGKRVNKTWVAANGKRFKTWKDACAFLEAASDAKKPANGRKRASPDVSKAAKKDTKRRKPASASKKSKQQQEDDDDVNDEEEEEAAAAAADSDADVAAEADAGAASSDGEDDAAAEEDGGSDAEMADAEEDAAAPQRAVGSGRQAAQGKKAYNKAQRLSTKDQVVKSEKTAKSEAAAWEETAQEEQAAAGAKLRRLLHFEVRDAAGEMQPLERLELIKEPLQLTGAVYPATGPLDKDKGRMLAKPFGPATAWHLTYSTTSFTVVVTTAQGTYQVSKPSPSYRKVFNALEEQANLTWHVLQAIEPSFGGAATASLDAVVAKLARAKAGKGYHSAREALLLNGRFVLAQLAAHEARACGGAAAMAKGKGKAGITAGAFYTELQAEVAKGPVRVGAVNANGAITIKDVSAAGAAAAAGGGSAGEQPADAAMEADEDYARRLQAKMDAQAMGGNKGRGQGGARGNAAAYIRISEFEIADDYPMPLAYKAPADVEETDELLLWDEEMADVDPELLPRRLLTDFSIYNAEGFCASLELLPMGAGVDPDCELFASGIVKDDEDDWGVGAHQLVVKQAVVASKSRARGNKKQQEKEAGEGVDKEKEQEGEAAAAGGSSGADAAGGSSKAAAGGSAGAGGSSKDAPGGSGSGGAGGSSADAAPEPAAGTTTAAADDAAEPAAEEPDPVAQGGMRLYLSQIREWVVEYSADMLFISIRTDAAWYKLCRPNPKYAPWFNVPLKSARVAVAVINMLTQQARASRLSFGDVLKRLAEEPQDSGLFISKKLDRVERFLVVHGQILLSQLKAYPSKDVQRSPFVGSLKEKMEARRHSKLYYSKRGFSKAPNALRAVNRNPMKDRAASGRSKPMPATTTSMVRAIWQNYFYAMNNNNNKPEGEGAEGAEAAGGSNAAVDEEEAPTAQEVEDDPIEEDLQDEEDDREEALGSSPAKQRKRKPTAAAAAKSKKAAAAAAAEAAAAAAAAAPKPEVKVEWVGSSTKDAAGRLVYRAAQAGSSKVEVGSVVLLEADETSSSTTTAVEGAEGAGAAAGGSRAKQQHEQYVFGLVQCLYQQEAAAGSDADSDDEEATGDKKMAQVRLLVPGAETVLGDAAADAELFVTDEYELVELSDVCGLASVKRLQREADHESRLAHFKADEELRRRNAAAVEAGRPMEYFYRHLYLPQLGMFKALPEDMEEHLGKYREAPAGPVALGYADNGGFVKDGVEYKVGDFMYVDPSIFDFEAAAASSSDEGEDAEKEEEEAEESDKDDDKEDLPNYMKRRGRFHKGSITGLRAWVIARLVEVAGGSGSGNSSKRAGGAGSSSSSAGGGAPSKVLLQRYYRPEDVSKDAAYKAGFWDLYASPAPTKKAAAGGKKDKKEAAAAATAECDWVQWVEVKRVIKKCAAKGAGQPVPEAAAGLHCFEVKGTYNPTTKDLTAPPKDFEAAAAANGDAMEVDGAAAAGAAGQQQQKDPSLAMASLDIFAGCGGLSEGMHQAGVAESKWAIEYEQPAADAFKLNNPDASVFCNNCNAILVAAMQKAGLNDDCLACEDACTQAAAMPAEEVSQLPLPGEVEFIMGGPPCQGYSGMNRFNKGNWSMVQNSMVMAFLSYCDFYRPRYFLLENVRNFVSHNKSFTFRLTLRTLLDMGYQVRFGVLNAGNYGVPQSRKRTFIWAAAPDECLPDWPQPLHVFRSPQLTVNLPGGVAYCAVDTSLPAGAPLRTVTVRDAIQDLPVIENGHSEDVMPYAKGAESAYQKKIRGSNSQLRDHICKEMNPVNLHRCKCIPKETPGADWRVLADIVREDPSREMYEGVPLVPPCLPNTAARHNGWRGLYGRLDLDGHFPTSTTDPQPMGKVGQVFHPNQDRIVSVRECARSQGFPDHFRFSGNVHSRHRQVGNAVPPPLAAALGGQLYAALEATHKAREAAMLG